MKTWLNRIINVSVGHPGFYRVNPYGSMPKATLFPRHLESEQRLAALFHDFKKDPLIFRPGALTAMKEFEPKPRSLVKEDFSDEEFTQIRNLFISPESNPLIFRPLIVVSNLSGVHISDESRAKLLRAFKVQDLYKTLKSSRGGQIDWLQVKMLTYSKTRDLTCIENRDYHFPQTQICEECPVFPASEHGNDHPLVASKMRELNVQEVIAQNSSHFAIEFQMMMKHWEYYKNTHSFNALGLIADEESDLLKEQHFYSGIENGLGIFEAQELLSSSKKGVEPKKYTTFTWIEFQGAGYNVVNRIAIPWVAHPESCLKEMHKTNEVHWTCPKTDFKAF